MGLYSRILRGGFKNYGLGDFGKKSVRADMRNLISEVAGICRTAPNSSGILVS